MRISDWSSDVCSSDLVNALFMVVGSLWAAAMLAAGLGVAAVFASVAAVNAVAAFCICRLLPDELLKSLFAIPLRLAFRVQVNGLDNCRKAGPRAVIRSEEHTSELQSLMRISYAVFCLKTKNKQLNRH